MLIRVKVWKRKKRPEWTYRAPMELKIRVIKSIKVVFIFLLQKQLSLRGSKFVEMDIAQSLFKLEARNFAW